MNNCSGFFAVATFLLLHVPVRWNVVRRLCQGLTRCRHSRYVCCQRTLLSGVVPLRFSYAGKQFSCSSLLKLFSGVNVAVAHNDVSNCGGRYSSGVGCCYFVLKDVRTPVPISQGRNPLTARFASLK